jgi:hypothetical protein
MDLEENFPGAVIDVAEKILIVCCRKKCHLNFRFTEIFFNSKHGNE